MHKKITGGFSLGLALLTVALFGPSARADLLVAGGFETPVLTGGGINSGYLPFYVNQTITGSPWTVVSLGSVSQSDDVAVYPNAEKVLSPEGLYVALNVQEGTQALDLTGDQDDGAAIGVSQSFATTPGSLYSLSFYVGQLDDKTRGLAIVEVDLNGISFQTASHGVSTGDTGATVWELFSYNFTAAGDTTTLSFINNSVSYHTDDHGPALNGLDDIVVNPVNPSAVPEPSAIVLSIVQLIGVFGMLGFVRLKNSRKENAAG